VNLLPIPNARGIFCPDGPARCASRATVAAIVFGLVVGPLMNASITYAGLKIGFTIGGSTIAALDGALEEAEACLEEAANQLHRTRETLAR
jgi:hypothetical protein